MAQALERTTEIRSLVGRAVLERVEAVTARRRADPARPSITLSYAQSLDGCISEDSGVTTPISNRESLILTHHLRAMHDALLVGVNTIIIDDPRLTVRLAPGDNPVAVVVDSRLRIPLQRRILQEDNQLLVAAVPDVCHERRAALEKVGAEVLLVDANPDGSVDLVRLFESLRKRGIRSVLVEGGAKIITSILAADLADQLVLTISPQFLGGVRSVEPLFGRGPNRRPELKNVFSQAVGDDLVVQGELVRSAHGTR